MKKNQTQNRNRVYDTLHDTKKIFVPLSTKFVLRNYLKKDGTAQMYLHVHSDGQRKRIALDLYLSPKHWSHSKQRAKKRNGDFNLILENIKASCTEIKTQFRLSKEVLTLEKFVHEFHSDFSRFDFLAFMQNAISEEENLVSKGAHRRYKAVLSKLKRYKTKMLFSDITFSTLREIRTYLKEIGNSQNTIESNIAVIRKYLRLAKNSGIAFPLDVQSIKVKPQIGNRKSLRPKQIAALYDYFQSSFIPEERKLVLGYFLFSCFTGIRIGDLQKIKRTDIKDSFQIITNKNKKTLTINLTEKAKSILLEEPRLFIDFFSDKHINEMLKDIAKTVGIKEKISFHIARHSFATNYLRMGGNVVYLSKLLGHADIKTTMIYESITQEEQNKEIDLLDNMF